MINQCKWVATIILILVVGSNAFDVIYDTVYPWNVLAGAVASTMLVRVSIAQNDKPYLMLNAVVALIYWAGFIQGVL